MGVFGTKKCWILAQFKKNTLIKLRYKKCNKIFRKQFFNNLFKIGYSKIYRIKMKN